jgi:outer membrane protein assembly factor BamB
LLARLRCNALYLALAISGCTCDDGVIVGGASNIAADTDRLDFGRVFLGASVRKNFNLSAPGELAVEYELAFDGDAFGYSAGPAVEVIGANGSIEIAVTFRPIIPGVRDAKLLVFSDATETNFLEIELTGEGVVPPDCEDGNGCTIDTFDIDTGRCEHEAARVPCDDFNACTINDTCVEGVCLGESRSCDDGDVCTDDLCNRETGCENLIAAACEDSNPCTADLCDPVGGCSNETLPDGTPCDDFEQCTVADICLLGECIGVGVPDGTMCDDLDPCSLNDQCIDEMCLDPNYTRPGLGDLKFATDVGPTQSGAGRNVIVDRDSTAFVGIEDGVAAVDQCGAVLWSNDALPGARFSGAVSLPGILSVPVGARIVDVDTVSGAVSKEIDLSILFAPIRTSSTATSTVRVLDLALRASGALVASVVLETLGDEIEERHGLLAEIDRSHTVATVFRDLGDRFASRLAVDVDEAVIALVSDGRPDKGLHEEQIVRFGIDGLPETTWSSNHVLAGHTDVGLGTQSQVLWTAGLVSIDRTGTPTILRIPPEDPLLLQRGAPVVNGDQIVFVEARALEPPIGTGTGTGLGLVSDASYHLLSVTATTGEIEWSFPLPAPAARMSPVVDLQGNVFVTTADGRLYAFTSAGTFIFAHDLPVGLDVLEDVALTITPENVVVAVGRGRVFGVQSIAPLGISSWPRHRRDNFSTGHR